MGLEDFELSEEFASGEARDAASRVRVQGQCLPGPRHARAGWVGDLPRLNVA